LSICLFEERKNGERNRRGSGWSRETDNR
jgi:hypothetical protein